MATIEISDDSADLLFKDVLVCDYTFLRNDIMHAEARLEAGETLKPYELEDLQDWKKYVNAFDTILGYYLTQADFDTLQAKLK